jgi:hypothetical protein
MIINSRLGKIVAGLFFAILMVSFTVSATPVKLNDNPNEIRITDNNDHGFKVSFSFSEFKTLDVKTSEGIFTKIIADAYARLGNYGHPEVPVKSELIEIPAGADVMVNVTRFDVKEYLLRDLGINYPLMPHQPPVPKTGEPVEFVYVKDAYRVNAFNPVDIARVEYLGSMREVGIGRLDIMPVQYNPVTGVIRVYENLEIEVIFENADLAKTELNKKIYGNHYFSGVLSSLINHRRLETSSRENLTRYPVKYVIVSDRMFEAQLQPLIAWKIQKGFNVIEAYTDDPNVGSTASQIKAFLQDLYENATPEDPAPSFVLFVGDLAQVPVFYGQAASHETDLYYCEYTGDYFPEAFYGRFSAQNTAQLQPQIDKTLMVEQYTMPVASYQDTVVMIAGMDGTYGPIHGNGQINYGTENYFNLSNGLYSHTYLYPMSGSNSAQIRQNISDGVSFANYTAHGSPSGWANPSFTVSHIPALQNSGKYGLLVGNCCSTSEYEVSECFGEAIVRAAGKGAVGYIGASNSTFWDEDYYFGVGVGAIAGDPPSYEETTLGAYDRMFHTHGEPFAEWYTTMDQMVFAGNLAVTEGSPGSALYYWEAYCLMGDPSLMICIGEPPAMTVTYDPLIPIGSPTFTVNAVPYAYVAITMDGLIMGTALADSTGVALIDLIVPPNPGNADVVATAQNFQPFIGTVLFANPEGPYLVLNQFMLSDTNGNGNGMAEFGEDILLDLELKNWGNGDAVSADVTLSTEDEYVTIIDDYQLFGDIPAQDSAMQINACNFIVDEYVPDMHTVNFMLEIQDDTRGSWGSTFSVILFAPEMEIGRMMIVDTAGGNGNYRLDPGESFDIVLECHNQGHCDAYGGLAEIESSSPYITFEETSCTFDTLFMFSMKQAVFSASLSEDVPESAIVDLHCNLSYGPYTDEKLFNAPVGLVIEDYETGSFESFAWIMGGTQPWTITGDEYYEGMYSTRSGIIGHEQTSVISIDIDVAVDDSLSFFRRVSCEDDPDNDNYDWLGFFIDDVEIERWDGEMAWSRVVYPVAAGQHTFKWVYNKDYSVAAGADAAWIDFVTFPVAAPAISVGEQPEEMLSDFYIMPNPARDHTELFIRLQKSSRIAVTVYDLAGNKVDDAIIDQKLDAGNNRIRLETANLAPGAYFCVMTSGGNQHARKLIINK